jgi:hypothetical protein
MMGTLAVTMASAIYCMYRLISTFIRAGSIALVSFGGPIALGLGLWQGSAVIAFAVGLPVLVLNVFFVMALMKYASDRGGLRAFPQQFAFGVKSEVPLSYVKITWTDPEGQERVETSFGLHLGDNSIGLLTNRSEFVTGIESDERVTVLFQGGKKPLQPRDATIRLVDDGDQFVAIKEKWEKEFAHPSVPLRVFGAVHKRFGKQEASVWCGVVISFVQP